MLGLCHALCGWSDSSPNRILKPEILFLYVLSFVPAKFSVGIFQVLKGLFDLRDTVRKSVKSRDAT